MLQFDSSGISPSPACPEPRLPYLGHGAPLDANGNITIPVPNGITLINPKIILNNGLIIPFTLHPITGTGTRTSSSTRSTGSVLVDDQPPVVTGTPDRASNADGWYNAPVTITWTSTDPAPSSGTPNTPAAGHGLDRGRQPDRDLRQVLRPGG